MKPAERPRPESLGPQGAYKFALDTLSGRWPEGEPVIAKDAGAAYAYARDVLHGRFAEGEPAIARDKKRAYEYARVVVKDDRPERWGEEYRAKPETPMPEGEEAIARDAGWACCYARDVLHGRFAPGMVYEIATPLIRVEDQEVRKLFSLGHVCIHGDSWTSIASQSWDRQVFVPLRVQHKPIERIYETIDEVLP